MLEADARRCVVDSVIYDSQKSGSNSIFVLLFHPFPLGDSSVPVARGSVTQEVGRLRSPQKSFVGRKRHSRAMAFKASANSLGACPLPILREISCIASNPRVVSYDASTTDGPVI